MTVEFVVEQSGICGEGYYRQDGNTGSTMIATMDCSGVFDDNEGEYTPIEGYLRVDSINTGTESGSFYRSAIKHRYFRSSTHLGSKWD